MAAREMELRPRSLFVAVVVLVIGGGSLFSGLVWAAAKGAFGKLGEASVGWLLEHSADPKDMETQRALALRRQSEQEREAEFRRQEEQLKNAHEREVDIRNFANRILVPTARNRQPILIPKGMCVLDGDNYRCNPDEPANDTVDAQFVDAVPYTVKQPERRDYSQSIAPDFIPDDSAHPSAKPK